MELWGRRALSALNKAHLTSVQLWGDLGLLVGGINSPSHGAAMFFLHFRPLYLRKINRETHSHAVTKLVPRETNLTIPGNSWIWFCCRISLPMVLGQAAPKNEGVDQMQSGGQQSKAY